MQRSYKFYFQLMFVIINKDQVFSCAFLPALPREIEQDSQTILNNQILCHHSIYSNNTVAWNFTISLINVDFFHLLRLILKNIKIKKQQHSKLRGKKAVRELAPKEKAVREQAPNEECSKRASSLGGKQYRLAQQMKSTKTAGSKARKQLRKM